MTSNVRVGVVGVGYLGRYHARIYDRMPNVTLAGVVDTDPKTASEIGDELGCPAYFDANELLDKVDAVSIVVPTIHHVDIARPFLENGVHMLMEKPIAPTVEASLQLVELAEKAGVIFQVGFLERFNAGVMMLAERVSDPRFIAVDRLSTFVERATDVDVITDLMIHDIDIVVSLVNSEITYVSAVGSPVLTEHVDIANARLEFANGAVADVTASRVSNKQLRRMRLFERKHYYGLNYVDQQLDFVSTEVRDPDALRPEIVSDRIEVEAQKPLDAELAEFINSVNTGKPPLVDGRVGLEAVKVAHLVKEKVALCHQQ